MIIVIKDFAKNALSEKAGTMLREKILQAYTTNQSENIVLDFNEINLFATMFFNASIGYLIKENKDEILEKIKVQNISTLGEKTKSHSIANAKFINEKHDRGMIEKIIINTIGEA